VLRQTSLQFDPGDQTRRCCSVSKQFAFCLHMQLSEVCSRRWPRLVAPGVQVHFQEIRQRPSLPSSNGMFHWKSLWVVPFFWNIEALRGRHGPRLGSTWKVISFPVSLQLLGSSTEICCTGKVSWLLVSSSSVLPHRAGRFQLKSLRFAINRHDRSLQK
jgi:hypothetical protein